MKKRIQILFCLLVLLLFVKTNAEEPERTYLIVNSINNPAPGYMFFGDGEVSTSIFNNYGKLIDSAQVRSLPPGLDLRFQSNGILTFCASRNRKYYSLDENYKIVDTFYVTNGYDTDIHEFLLNKDGSYFLIALENIPVDMSKLVANGKSNAIVENQIIQKYNAQKQLVWSWSCHANLPVTDCVDDPDEVNLTQITVDPYHVNSLDLDSDGNLLVSIRNFNELIKINPNDGKIIWRMGGSKSKNNQFDFTNDVIDGFTGFSHTHNAHWLKNGNLLLFDNGNTRQNKFSRAVEYKVNESTKKVEKVWEYSTTPKIFAPVMCGAQRLDNGNTFITFGNLIYEADKNSNTVFDATKTGGLIYRGYKYIHKMFSVQKDIAATGTFDFNDANNLTSSTMSFQNVETPGYLNVSRYPYKPERYTFQDLEPSKMINQRWVVESNFNFVSKLTIDLNAFTDYDKTDSIVAYIREDEDKGSFTKLISTFNNFTGKITIDLTKEGEIILSSFDQVGSTTLKMITPRNGDVVGNSAKFTWYKVPSAQQYEFQLSTKDDFSQLIVNELSLTSNSFSVSNLANGKSYYFRARAKLGNITSKWSEVWKVNVMLTTPLQLIPKNNSKQVLLNDKLVWNKVATAIDYQVQVTKDTNSAIFVLNKFAIADSSLSLDSIINNTKYSWRVRSSNTDVKSNWSAYKTFRTEIRIPEIKLPLNNSTVNSSFNLDFDRSAGIEFYQVMISKDSNFTPNTLTLLSGKQQTAILNLESNQKYFLKLRAIAIDDTSRWANAIAVNTLLAKPKLLIPVNNDIINESNVKFEITSIMSATSYEINLISETKNGLNKLIDTNFSTNSTSFTLENIQDGTKNSWRARAVNSLEKSEWTSYFIFLKEAKNNLQAPLLLLPENNALNTSVNGFISWAGTNVVGVKYKVVISQSISFDSLHADELEEENNNYYYSNLKFGTKYYWKVATEKDNVFSKWSETRNFTTKSVDLISSPNLFIPKLNDTIDIKENQFIWEEIVNAGFYHLQIAKDINFNNLLTNEENLLAYTYKESKLELGNKYYWRVQVKQSDSLKYGDWSVISEFYTLSETNIIEGDEELQTRINLNEDYTLYDYLGKEIYTKYQMYENINELKESLKSNIYFLVPKNIEKKKKVLKIVTY